MLRIFKNFKKKEVMIVCLSLVFIVAQVYLDLKLPDYMSEITKIISTKGKMHSILNAGGKMLACAFGSLFCSIIVAVFASKVASNFSATLRAKLFYKVQSFSMEEIGRFSTASLITRSTNDVNQVQMLVVMGLQAMIKAPIMAVWAICKIADKSWQWTMSTGVAVVVLLSIVVTCVCIAMPKFKKIQALTDDINRVTRENLTGIRVVRAYNAEQYQENKFEDCNTELTNTHLFTMRTMSFMMPSIQVVMNGLALAVYWVGAVLINNAGNINDKVNLFSDMVVFSQYAIQVVMSFMMLVVIFIMWPRASVAALRILEVLDTEATIYDGDYDDKNTSENTPASGNGEKKLKGEIVFDKVSFKYPDAEDCVISDISFTAHQGETVAFIGATGCGKSTIINLIPRFYDVTEGNVLVDGVNVKDYTQYALHNKIGYVSQKAILFGGDIAGNVSYGDNGRQKDDENVKKAIEVAQASEFVDKLDDGEKSFVAQGGANLSGGQKQRISIARAIFRHPEILIFDDSFSALDYKTDRILREALEKECKEATKLIVAQRIGTIMEADKIIVIEDGKIAGMGTHKELMKDCKVYQEIAYSQLSKEELA